MHTHTPAYTSHVAACGGMCRVGEESILHDARNMVTGKLMIESRVSECQMICLPLSVQSSALSSSMSDQSHKMGCTPQMAT